MNKLEILHAISKYLSRFSEQVKILNAASDFSINKISEDILIYLLNQSLNLNLVNLNFSEDSNYPAIDLIDKQKRIAIQVTATKEISKIKDCLTKLFTSDIYKNVDNLFVYVLTEKREKYSQQSISLHLKKLNLQHGKKFTFDINKSVLDKRDIYKIFQNINSIDRLKEIEVYLQKNFDLLIIKEGLSSYYEMMKNWFYDVVFDDESGMTLKDIYVDPSFAIHESSIKHDITASQGQNSNFIKSKDTRSLNSFLSDFIHGSISLNLRLKNPRCLLVLGYPGQGKTSCLKKLLNFYLTTNLQPDRDIFFFKLKNIRQGKLLVDSPLNVLYDEACLDTELELNKNNFKKSILLLDGLDELFMKENMKLDDIEKICKEISKEVERHTNLIVILTSRYGYVDLHRIQKESCLVIQIGLLSKSQQLLWVENFQKFHQNAWLTQEKISEFNDEKKQSYNYIKELISQPILLQIISTLKDEIDLDASRSLIYNKLFTDLIERKYSSDGQLENFQNITKEDLRFLLQEIAFAIHKSGNGYITKKELLSDKNISNYLLKFPNEDFKNNIKGILISFYFRENKKDPSDDDNTAIEFLHKSLQEYMTAEKIERSMFDLFLDRNRKDEYIIDSYEDTLFIINNLFAFQTLTDEIQDYITELIQNRDTDECMELSTRLAKFLNQLTQHDFLFGYSLNFNHPIEMGLRSFQGYWLFLLTCNANTNYLTNSEVRQRIVEYLVLSDNSNFMEGTYTLIQSQNLSDVRLANISIYGSDIIKVDFFETHFYQVSIGDSIIKNTNFRKAEFFDTEFWHGDIIETSFEEAEFQQIEFSRVNFDNVTFRGAYFDNVTFRTCNFEKLPNHCFTNLKLTERALKAFQSAGVTFDVETCLFVDEDDNYIPITKQLLYHISNREP